MLPRVASALGLAMAAAVWLSGCAETTLTIDTAKALTAPTRDAAPGGYYKVGRPYTIRGRTYVPREDYEYDQVGIASWYGPKFHGGTTANGEIFDQNALTAAHPTLPMPSMIRVTNLENGRSIDLRVNDRGPFADNRILDVSKRAAELLGFREAGTTRVRVVNLADESLAMRDGYRSGRSRGSSGGSVRLASASTSALARPPTRKPPPGGWFIQAGAFSNTNNARTAADTLSGLAPTHLVRVHRGGRTLTRVRLGPLPDGREAAHLLQAVQASGYPDARLVAN